MKIKILGAEKAYGKPEKGSKPYYKLNVEGEKYPRNVFPDFHDQHYKGPGLYEIEITKGGKFENITSMTLIGASAAPAGAPAAAAPRPAGSDRETNRALLANGAINAAGRIAAGYISIGKLEQSEAPVFTANLAKILMSCGKSFVEPIAQTKAPPPPPPPAAETAAELPLDNLEDVPF